ncbi:hypothetical protein M5D96_011590 [Drosophila gunungcola]|uniref:Uncharacterized protein n=1 Tax=Drosophila gunungcola TaxID=103775 RepID=A0A9Q0BKH9_9MUSC|nr:hypothetical protein M5D96_011590 [Drosophila gunungcola]
MCTGSTNFRILSFPLCWAKKGKIGLGDLQWTWTCTAHTNIIRFWTGFATQMDGQREKLCCLSKYFSWKLWSNTIFFSLWQQRTVAEWKNVFVYHMVNE